MQALTLPASAGWQWLLQGYRLYRRQPALIGLLVMSYWLSLIFLNILPFLGPLLASLVLPGLSVGVMTACREVDNDRPAAMSLFVEPLKRNPKPLLLLGGIYLLCTLAALVLSIAVDGGVLLETLTSGQPLDEEALAESDILLAAQFCLLIMLPVLMAYWFAPALVAWHGLSVSKALFFSFIACLRNWRAFLIYGAGVVVMGAFVPGLAVGFLVSLMPGVAQFATTLVTLFLLMVMAPTLFASFYISYREVFIVREHISEHA